MTEGASGIQLLEAKCWFKTSEQPNSSLPLSCETFPDQIYPPYSEPTFPPSTATPGASLRFSMSFCPASVRKTALWWSYGGERGWFWAALIPFFFGLDTFFKSDDWVLTSWVSLQWADNTTHCLNLFYFLTLSTNDLLPPVRGSWLGHCS